jgi:tetratricopeptide (TPR) repeat protein
MRETLPLLPLADALGELSRVDRGDMLETALAVAPRYVRVEVARLVPELRSGTVEPAGPDSGQRDRLFAAIADLFSAVARRQRIVLVVEDVHWADAATLDCLTFLTRARRDPALTVVVTCRSDEAPLESHVVEWLAHVREQGGVAQIGRGPLSRADVAEQVAELSGSPAPAPVVDELYARAEGNPFFTEQLVMAAGLSEDGLRASARLPEGLAELLVTRAARCGGPARTVLSTLAVAGRPLGEDLIDAASGLDADDVRGGLRELTVTRLLADATPGGEQRPRHALLAEAVAADLLPSEKISLHERLAEALQTVGDDTFAAEVAGHWGAAGRTAAELPARVRAAEAAERLFSYLDAATHWQRAIELYEKAPNAEQLVAIDLPHLYLRGFDALCAAGDSKRSSELAEDADRRFADHPDPAVAASVHLRLAWCRRERRRSAAYEQALSLFERLPPSVEQAKAWYSYGQFMFSVEGRGDVRRAALTRALDVAEAAGATGVAASVQMSLAHEACLRGQVAEGLALVERARTLAEASNDGETLVEVAGDESEIR